jgi:hypothetical protein
MNKKSSALMIPRSSVRHYTYNKFLEKRRIFDNSLDREGRRISDVLSTSKFKDEVAVKDLVHE